MGSGMAANLIKAGISLTVYNRTPAKAEPLVSMGAHFAPTPAEAAKDASIVIGMLADDAAPARCGRAKTALSAPFGQALC